MLKGLDFFDTPASCYYRVFQSMCGSDFEKKWYSVCSLYWYKSTNADAAAAALLLLGGG